MRKQQSTKTGSQFKYVIFFIFIFVTLFTNPCFSQGAAVNTTGATADPSAMLDVSGAAKGVLINRMSTTERNTITNPATGLQIFNTTTMCFEFFAYGVWQTMACATCPTPSAPSAGTHTPSDYQIIWNWNTVSGATGYKYNTANDYGTATDNGATTSYTQTGLSCGTNYTLYIWAYNSCGNYSSANIINESTTGTIPSAAPTAGTHTPSDDQIIWNWGTVSGATGYKYNTVNDYASATDNGNSTSYTQTSLNCNSQYTLYVWAYSSCANSSATTLTESTSACPFYCGTSTVTFTYRGGSVTYGTALNTTTNECWLDRNLGASQVATSFDDVNAYGDLFQWGRLDDGHQDRNSTTTTTLSSSDNPGHSNFITAPSSPNDWRTPQNNSLWQGVSGTNNPCPSGWRIPVESELSAERLSWSSQNYYGAFASAEKWTAGGAKDKATGQLENVGIGGGGRHWASTVSGTEARMYYFNDGSAAEAQATRGNAFSVRCIKD